MLLEKQILHIKPSGLPSRPCINGREGIVNRFEVRLKH